MRLYGSATLTHAMYFGLLHMKAEVHRREVND